jgi:hypothetical protein
MLAGLASESLGITITSQMTFSPSVSAECTFTTYDYGVVGYATTTSTEWQWDPSTGTYVQVTVTIQTPIYAPVLVITKVVTGTPVLYWYDPDGPSGPTAPVQVYSYHEASFNVTPGPNYAYTNTSWSAVL